MKRVFYFMSLMCIILFASCSSENDVIVEVSPSGKKITIGVGMPDNDGTRVSTADLANIVWEAGDEITLMGYDDNNVFKGRNNYRILSGNGTKNAKFEVYTIDGATKYKVFYKAPSVTIKDNGTEFGVDYSYQIREHLNDSKPIKETIILGSEDIAANAMGNGISLSARNSVLKINIRNLHAEQKGKRLAFIRWSVDDIPAADIAVAELRINENADNYFYMAFNPYATPLSQGGTLKLDIEMSINDGGVRKSATAISKNGIVYEPGKVYNVSIGNEVKSDGVSKWGIIGSDDSNDNGDSGDNIDWKNKTCWVYGINDVPPIDQWGYFQKAPYEIRALEWTQGCGWFDCTKVDPVHPESPSHDSNLCWAASTSNMIYWWLERNKDNIEKYGRYTGPKEYRDALDCEVFQYFKDHFTNYGGYISSALNWFFKATPVNVSDGTTSHGSDKWPAHTGFFKDVLGNSKIFRAGVVSDFGNELKKAFVNKESIGISIEVSGGTGSHAINIWGAEFDGDGELCKIYIVENNDPDPFTNPQYGTKVGLYPKNVKKFKVNNGYEYRMESSSQGKFTIPITSVIFLGTHEEKWKYFLNSHK